MDSLPYREQQETDLMLLGHQPKTELQLGITASCSMQSSSQHRKRLHSLAMEHSLKTRINPCSKNAHTLQIPVAASDFSPSMIKPKQEKIQNT